MSKNIETIEIYVKSVMGDEVAHDFKHVDRVRNWALKIAKSEGFENLEILEAAVLLHDIGLLQAETRGQHGKVGAQMARDFLSKNGIFPENQIDQISHAVEWHCSIKKDDDKLLAIVRDADMMDMFGNVGIMRAYTSKASLPEYDPDNVKGATWGMTGRDFDEKFK